MADILSSPFLFVALGIVAYLLAYFVYGKRVDKRIFKPDAKKPTPAHTYMDGIEFFPANKYVLFGFQFKGIAALGPILGPFVAMTYGWLPALLWILLGNFFIGWIHDYSAIMLTVRNEGKTLGPLTYEYVSSRARNALIMFLLFYLVLLTATFIALMALYMRGYGASVLGTVGVVIAGITTGVLINRKVRLLLATLVGMIITAVGIVAGYFFRDYLSVTGALGSAGALVFWMIIIGILCFFAAVTPLLNYTQPVVYMATYPAIFGIILLIGAALLSPITGVAIQQPAASVQYWFAVPPGLALSGYTGWIWPMLTVSIACGAISGWHSLVGTSGTGRQLDIETDALPVGAGSMLTEGLLALSALAAYMVLSGALYTGANWLSLIAGAQILVGPLFGLGSTNPFIAAFFATWLVIFALTVEMLIIRFFRLSVAEATSSRPSLRTIFGNKYVATFLGLFIGALFASTGAWINLWMLFGGSNQLLAGLTLLLASMYLSKQKKGKWYTLGPALFMLVTCEAALLYEAALFFIYVFTGPPYITSPVAGIPIPNTSPLAAALNFTFGAIGLLLFVLGAIVAFDWYRAYKGAKVAKKKEK